MSETRGQLVDKIFDHFKKNQESPYDEMKHCKILIEVMMNPEKATISSFCIHPEVMVTERTFNKWINTHELFRSLYYFSKMLAREIWEREGRELRDRDYPMGTINHAFEYWKMIGWSRFGISKNSRIKLAIKEGSNPMELYQQILTQAIEGDFTASEFKQLMEAVNIGLNVHRDSELQKQIDELKSALLIMEQNASVQNPFTNKGIAQKD